MHYKKIKYNVVLGDFNNDGRQDLAVANFADRNIGILLNMC